MEFVKRVGKNAPVIVLAYRRYAAHGAQLCHGGFVMARVLLKQRKQVSGIVEIGPQLHRPLQGRAHFLIGKTCHSGQHGEADPAARRRTDR